MKSKKEEMGNEDIIEKELIFSTRNICLQMENWKLICE